MLKSSVVARPYAKAIFEFAVEENNLSEWSVILEALSRVVLDPHARDFIANPAVSHEQQVQLLLTPFASSLPQWDALIRWVKLVVEQGRVMVLPDIYALYQMLRADYEKTLLVKVRSFSKLTANQKNAMTERLTKKLKRQVSLEVSVDPSLLGGAVIQAHDLVIDGSVLGKLNAMYTELLA